MSRLRSFVFVGALCASLTAPPFADLAAAQGRGRGRANRTAAQAPRLPPAYQEPAFARGYKEGYETGVAHGKRRERYDPAASRNYRNGDPGYTGNYGSKDAYKNNYRSGFRQGYEDGYRAATR